MASPNRNINLECSICKKKMRSDNLRRHWLAKHKSFDFKVTTVVRSFLKDGDIKPSSIKDLKSEIVANGKLLDEKIALGENVSKVLADTNTKEESLSKNIEKLLTCIKAENYLSNQMMMSNFIPGSNKQRI